MDPKVMNPDEKKGSAVVQEETVSIEEQKPQGLDEAAAFLETHKDLDTSHIDISKLRHRIDRNVVSLLCLCFIMQLLDKAIYNVGIKIFCSGTLINTLAVHWFVTLQAMLECTSSDDPP
jgi:hypothetical protein